MAMNSREAKDRVEAFQKDFTNLEKEIHKVIVG